MESKDFAVQVTTDGKVIVNRESQVTWTDPITREVIPLGCTFDELAQEYMDRHKINYSGKKKFFTLKRTYKTKNLKF